MSESNQLKAGIGMHDRFILLLLAISLSANVWLGVLLHQSSATASQLATASNIEDLPAVGARLDELHLANVDGSPVVLESSGSLPTLVYVLSPTCGWCNRNKGNIKALVEQVKDKYRIIGISTTSKDLKPYTDANSLGFPIYYVQSKAPNSTIRLNATPETLIFSPQGRFIRGWDGAYIGKVKEGVSSFFNAKLPS